ncbi:MAG: GIY-YIG nuclease family protein [Parcubacteria group bacterium]|nr:GIY-YIG nuclease family protein [Parcubacteria group bacterium]
MYYVYVLKSEKDFCYYTGLTDNLYRRVKEHNSGRNFSTKHRKPFTLCHCEKFDSRKKAREREKFLKSGCGREWVKDNFDNVGC